MIDMTTLHAQLVGAEGNIRAARLAIERAIADGEQAAQPDPKKPPPTFGDATPQPQER